MKFTNEKLGCSFEVPDRPTVRQRLEWMGTTANADGEQLFIRYWDGLQRLLTGWECAALPDVTVPIDEMTDPAQAQIVMWAGTAVLRHMLGLEDVPKN